MYAKEALAIALDVFLLCPCKGLQAFVEAPELLRGVSIINTTCMGIISEPGRQAMASCLSQDILHCQEIWAYGQSFVGHRRTSYRECPTKIRGLVMIAQTSVRNGTDTCLRRFYHDVLGEE